MTGIKTAAFGNNRQNAPYIRCSSARYKRDRQEKMDGMKMNRNVLVSSKPLFTLIILVRLAGGFLADRYGDLSIWMGDSINGKPLDNMKH